MYLLNHAVEGLVVGTLFSVNQPLIDVFLFNTQTAKEYIAVGPFDEGEARGQGSLLTHSTGDPGFVGDGLRFHPAAHWHPPPLYFLFTGR